MGLDGELTGLENIKLQSHFRNYSKKQYDDFLDNVIFLIGYKLLMHYQCPMALNA